MNESKLITFFKEANNYTRFERIKYVYDITNNLDLDLLFDLKKEYHLFYISKIVAINRTENANSINKNTVENEVESQFDVDVNKGIDVFLEVNEYSKIEDVVNETALFMEDINELIKRKIKSTSKKPRIKTDGLYKQFIQNEFLEEDFHHDISFNDEDFGVEYLGSRIEEDIEIDLSDTSITGKIIYLEKIGVLDFLSSHPPFNTSTNRMASVLSAITGAKPTSIQPMINPILSREVDNKNNPLRSKNLVAIIENKLMSLGFEIKKRSKE